MDKTDIEARLSALGTALATSRVAVGEGRPVDLTDLDREIDQVCALVLAQREEGRAYVPTLHQLVDNLDALAADLKQQIETPA